MRALGKVVFLFILGAMVIGCSLNGQVQKPADMYWSGHYQAMYDQVSKNYPEKDHVLMFCDEMIKVSKQFEHHDISSEQFITKQMEMRKLLQREDEYRKAAVWSHEDVASGPMELYLKAKYTDTVTPREEVSTAVPEPASTETSSIE